MIKIYLHFYKKWQNKISPSKEKKERKKKTNITFIILQIKKKKRFGQKLRK